MDNHCSPVGLYFDILPCLKGGIPAALKGGIEPPSSRFGGFLLLAALPLPSHLAAQQHGLLAREWKPSLETHGMLKFRNC